VLPANYFKSAALKSLLQEVNNNIDVDMCAVSINLILSAIDCSVDELINTAYIFSDIAVLILACLHNPDCC
jgi:hypothetical protein